MQHLKKYFMSFLVMRMNGGYSYFYLKIQTHYCSDLRVWGKWRLNIEYNY